MKFKIDENLPVEVADDLVQEGHDALTVKDQQLSGQVDANLARICQAEGRALLTLDLDFADIREYPPADYPGLIVLRGLAVEGAHSTDYRTCHLCAFCRAYGGTFVDCR